MSHTLGTVELQNRIAASSKGWIHTTLQRVLVFENNSAFCFLHNCPEGRCKHAALAALGNPGLQTHLFAACMLRNYC